MHINRDFTLDYINTNEKIRPTAIILHWWNIPTWFGGMRYFLWRMKSKDLSVQFVILKDGTVHQLVEDPATHCRHARCANASSIGIELQGFGSKDLDRQHKQYRSLIQLLKKLKKDYGIENEFRVQKEKKVLLRFYGITSHKNVDPYCNVSRVITKRDVHDSYLNRVISDLR